MRNSLCSDSRPSSSDLFMISRELFHFMSRCAFKSSLGAVD
jgi:hypothetical protein